MKFKGGGVQRWVPTRAQSLESGGDEDQTKSFVCNIILHTKTYIYALRSMMFCSPPYLFGKALGFTCHGILYWH